MVRNRAEVLAVVLAVGSMSLACGTAPEGGPAYLDLVTFAVTAPLPAASRPIRVGCADESHLALVFAPENEFAARVQLFRGAKLVASGCFTDPASSAALELTFEPARGAALRRTLDLSGEAGWWERQIDLSGFADRSGLLSLRARFPGGQLFVKDLYVSHEMPLPSREGPVPQALLISIDTLREDALGASIETPQLDRFVAEAQVWAPHYAGSGWTKPSHATLLTGQHGWMHRATVDSAAIDPRVETLAERFRRSGFGTAALVHDCLWLDPRWGFDRGFDEYRLLRWSLPQATRAVANWITDHRGERFFFFFHAFEPHSDSSRLPYESPGVTRGTILERFAVGDYGCRAGKCASELLMGINAGLPTIEGEEEILRYLYARSVREVDRRLGQLFDHLRRLELYDDMMIVLTADHGEEFLEHGKLLHGTFWEEVIRAPLVIKWPRGRFAGERRTVPSGAVDVAPTLLAEFGLDREGLPGTPLLERTADTPVYLVNGEWDAVIVDGMKAVSDLEELRLLLFDLAEDPHEARELAGTRTEQAQALAEMIAARIELDRRALAELESKPDADAPHLTPEERERLRSLGYVE